MTSAHDGEPRSGAEFTCDERIVADTGVIRIKIDRLPARPIGEQRQFLPERAT